MDATRRSLGTGQLPNPPNQGVFPRPQRENRIESGGYLKMTPIRYRKDVNAIANAVASDGGQGGDPAVMPVVAAAPPIAAAPINAVVRGGTNAGQHAPPAHRAPTGRGAAAAGNAAVGGRGGRRGGTASRQASLARARNSTRPFPSDNELSDEENDDGADPEENDQAAGGLGVVQAATALGSTVLAGISTIYSALSILPNTPARVAADRAANRQIDDARGESDDEQANSSLRHNHSHQDHRRSMQENYSDDEAESQSNNAGPSSSGRSATRRTGDSMSDDEAPVSSKRKTCPAVNDQTCPSSPSAKRCRRNHRRLKTPPSTSTSSVFSTIQPSALASFWKGVTSVMRSGLAWSSSSTVPRVPRLVMSASPEWSASLRALFETTPLSTMPGADLLLESRRRVFRNSADMDELVRRYAADGELQKVTEQLRKCGKKGWMNKFLRLTLQFTINDDESLNRAVKMLRKRLGPEPKKKSPEGPYSRQFIGTPYGLPPAAVDLGMREDFFGDLQCVDTMTSSLWKDGSRTNTVKRKPAEKPEYTHIGVDEKDMSQRARKMVDSANECKYGCECVGECMPATCACIKASVAVEGKIREQRFTKNRPVWAAVECCASCSCQREKRTCSSILKFREIKLQAVHFNNMGWGLRVMEPVLRGQPIMTFTGVYESEQTAENIDWGYTAANMNDPWMRKFTGLSKGVMILNPRDKGNASRMICHSMQSNCEFLRVFRGGMSTLEPEVIIFATENLEAGDILYLNYGDDFWKGKPQVKCGCTQEFCHDEEVLEWLRTLKDEELKTVLERRELEKRWRIIQFVEKFYSDDR